MSVLLCILSLTFASVNGQELGPNDVSPNTEDTRCIDKDYQHKTATRLEAMTAEDLIDEDVKHWNYHVSLMDKYGMFTLNSYQEKIGVAIIPVLTKIAAEFASRPRSKCQEQRFFNAFAIALDVDNQIIRLRSIKDGQDSISAATEAIERMKDAGLATDPYSKHPFGLYLLDSVRGINEHDGQMRAMLFSEFGVRLSDREFLRLVEFLTSTYPNYPSWTPRINMSRDLRKNKKKYYDAYLKFRKTVRASNVFVTLAV